MPQPRIHLVAPAAPCGPFLRSLKLDSAQDLIGWVQQIVGLRFAVTGVPELLDTAENDRTGGRPDDVERAKDLEAALADSSVAAIISLRGGAWFTRILPHIDFRVLERRTSRVTVFGFSELTPLINIVAAYGTGVGIYFMGPAFLTYGLRGYAATQLERNTPNSATPQEWMEDRLHDECAVYFRQVLALIEGRHGDVTITARCIAGSRDVPAAASFVGGNLSVVSPMVGSSYARVIDPKDRWLLLEDFNDKPERFDRFFSHLTLAGYWERCAGVLLGDFHNRDGDLMDAVAAMLRFHIPRQVRVPVLATSEVGHTWPMKPLPFNVPATITRLDDNRYSLRWSPAAYRTI